MGDKTGRISSGCSGSPSAIACWREVWSAKQNLPRHRHERAYIAVVLSGGYEECGSRGRFRVLPGDVLLHDAFDSHLDRFGNGRTQVLNLVIPELPTRSGLGRIADPDALVRAAERNPTDAGAYLRKQLCEAQCEPEDWPDLLARDLLADPDCRLENWASSHGLAAETVSRGFGRVFGVSPATFRLEARTRCALVRIVGNDEPLASIAAATGFADQAHMSRAVRSLTGLPPHLWRRSNSFKTTRASRD